jgi:hypothetical protein
LDIPDVAAVAEVEHGKHLGAVAAALLLQVWDVEYGV